MAQYDNERKCLSAIEREKQAYQDNIYAKIIPNIEFKFSLTDDGCIVVQDKYIQDFPATEDLMTLDCMVGRVIITFSQKISLALVSFGAFLCI